MISNKNLEIFREDIRDINENHFKDIDTVIHLANIANDPSVELNPNLSWDVNVVQSIKIIELAIKFHVKKFLYASSGSVYGVKEEDEVVEDLSLVPISIYNKTKIAAERIFLSYSDKINVYNMIGELIFTSNHETVINISDWESGVYFVKSGYSTVKILKQ